ncbi:hypothetical protein DERP_002741 [Dermatophagoides pteronyssinus]|uniref:Uncharacterized protein n=1 Tax=Dermatophagoides pteronyssinus TaxID=6956 RepID=A0ABQ8JWL6_DERPT|nr:hypothetical protein DERP_002741 [Dermatophagoides pteronyssinus]
MIQVWFSQSPGLGLGKRRFSNVLTFFSFEPISIDTKLVQIFLVMTGYYLPDLLKFFFFFGILIVLSHIVIVIILPETK